MARPIGHNNVAAIGVEGLSSTLRKGDTGTEVEFLQKNINTFADDPVISFEAGVYKVAVDGVFGSGTEDNVIKLQNFYSLTADGVNSSKIKINSGHDDHFHVDTKS